MRLLPSHTTRHAGPHRAVGIVDGCAQGCPSTHPEAADLQSGGSGFSLPWPFGLHPIHHIGEFRDCEHLRQSIPDDYGASSPIPSALRQYFLPADYYGLC